MVNKFTDSTSRNVHTRVKTAKKRSNSSARWLDRQLNDPYVKRAKQEGYRSRAAYKLLEMDDKLKILAPGVHIVDLGAAPGGWLQVAAARTKVNEGSGSILVGIDLLDIKPQQGVCFLQADFMEEDTPGKLITLMQGKKADIVLSDMAANASGHAQTDHIRIMALCEVAFDFALDVLKPGGTFLAKTLQGGTENDLLARMKQHFVTVKHLKPKASRADSAEMYVVASEFKGGI